MKSLKIIVAVIAALWALACVPNLISRPANHTGQYAFSHMMGSVAGLFLASAISITLFRSALRK